LSTCHDIICSDGVFAECLLIHSAKELAKGPTGGLLFRGPVPKTLGKEEAFAECHGGTQQSLNRHLAPTTTFIYRELGGTRQSLCRVPVKKYSTKKSLAMYSSPRVLCRVSHSAKSYLVFFRLAECFRQVCFITDPIILGVLYLNRIILLQNFLYFNKNNYCYKFTI
jgi:hypothetical protein